MCLEGDVRDADNEKTTGFLQHEQQPEGVFVPCV